METAASHPPDSAAPAFSLRQAFLSLMRDNWLLWLLVIAALLTRGWRLWAPDQVVFDELHFGNFVSGYFTGEYFFDIHPPLGKMLIAVAGWIGGYQPGFGFEVIGRPYGETAYLPMRAVPALFGALLVPLVYVLVRQIGGSRRAAYLASAVALLDAALLVQSRFILVDSILLFFGFLSLSLFLAARRTPISSLRWIGLLALTGVALGLAISVKWTGAGMLGLVGLAALIDLVFGLPGWRKLLFKAVAYGLLLALVPAMVYFYLWTLHFELLPKSGPGDAFMSPEFRASLEGASNTGEDSLNAFEKVWELNRTMYNANAGIRDDHPWQSRWWSWPFLPRGLSFWQETVDGQTARIYLLGLPYAWWMVMLGVLAFLYMAARRVRSARRLGDDDWKLLIGGGLLLAGILANWLPFANIERPLFLYHYFFSFVFSAMLASIAFDRLMLCAGGSRPARVVSIAGVALLVVGFLLYAPLSYGYTLPAALSDVVV